MKSTKTRSIGVSSETLGGSEAIKSGEEKNGCKSTMSKGINAREWIIHTKGA